MIEKRKIISSVLLCVHWRNLPGMRGTLTFWNEGTV